MPDVINLQRKIKLDVAPYRAFADFVTGALEETSGRDFAIALVSDQRMKELNRFFRGKDSTTDVLSFPHQADEFESPEAGVAEEYLGDIVISVEQAQKQAVENKLSLESEVKQLILHGLLHLCGYDHETDDGEMNRRELGLRRKLKI